GRSSDSGPGTYGWPSHARDVIEMADRLGAETFDVIGWSMGVWIAMVVAQMAPHRVRRVVLIDAAGLPEESIKVPVYAGLDRLATVFPSREAFMTLAKSLPQYQPWPPWERLFDYELVDVEGGVSFRTRKAAPWEDEQYRLKQDSYALWPALTMPTLLVRAAQQIPPNFGFLSMFGVGGLFGLHSLGVGVGGATLSGVVAGALGTGVVFGAFKILRQAESSESFSLQDMVGSTGRVSVAIPANKFGTVMISFAGASHNMTATADDEIAAGKQVKVVSVAGTNLVVTPTSVRSE